MKKIQNRSGQGLVEYALIIGLMAIVAISALSICSESANNFYFEAIPNALKNAQDLGNRQ